MVANASCGIGIASDASDSMQSPGTKLPGSSDGSASTPIGTCMPSWELAESLPSRLGKSAGRKGAIAG